MASSQEPPRHLTRQAIAIDRWGNPGAMGAYTQTPMEPLRRYAHRLGQFRHNARHYLLYTFVSGFGLGILRLFFNLYVLSAGHGAATLGALVAIPPIVIAVTALPMGLLGTRIGFRRTLLIGGGLMAISVAGIASSALLPALVVFGIARGLSLTLLQVSSAPFMSDNSGDAERTHLFSVQFAARTFSSTLGFLLAGVLPGVLAYAVGGAPEGPAAYRASLYVAAAILALAMLPLWRLDDTRGAASARSEPLRIKEILHPPGLMLRLFAPEVVIGLGAGALVPFLNVFFKMKFGVSDATLGLLFAGQSLLMGVTTLIGPLIVERIGKIRTVVGAQLLSIPFLLLLGYAPVFGLSAVGFFVRAALMNMGNPLYSAFAMEKVGPERRAAASGLLQISWQGMRSISSSVSGVLQQGPGFAAIFPLTIVCYLTASGMLYRFFGRNAASTPRSR